MESLASRISTLHPTNYFARLCLLLGWLFACGIGSAQTAFPDLQYANWAAPVSSNLAVTSNGGLKKTATGTTWYDAITTQKLVREGRIVFKVKSGIAGKLAIGLNFADTADTEVDIDYRLVVTSTTTPPTNKAVAFTGANTQTGAFAAAFTSDTVFTIERIGTEVRFIQDNGGGAVQSFTSTVPCAGTMLVDAAFSSQNSEILSCQIDDGDLDNDGMPDSWELANLPPNQQNWTDVVAFEDDGDFDLDGVSNHKEFSTGTSARDSLIRAKPVIWDTQNQTNTNSTGAGIVEGGIKKQTPGTSATYNAHAVSIQRMIGDGRLAFRFAAPTDATVGLNTLSSTAATTDVDWRFVTTATGTFSIYVNATLVTPNVLHGSYTNETVFAIQREGSTIRFLKDGAAIHTVANEIHGPLYANVWLSSPAAELSMARIYTGDEDNDQMPDSWERMFLPANPGWNDLDAFVWAGYGDNDPQSNGEEYLRGTSPRDDLSMTEAITWESVNANMNNSVAGELKKSSSGSAATYDASAVDTTAILADGAIAFKVPSGSVVTVGLMQDTSTTASTDVNWAVITTATGTYSLRANSVAVAALPAPNNAYASDTTFVIQRRDGIVSFLKDGYVVHTAAAISTGPLYATVWIATKTTTLTSTNIYTGDLDADLMPDAWELLYLPENANYTTLALFKPTGTSSNLLEWDPDQDGVSNLDEFNQGTNPRVAVSKASTVLWTAAPAGYLTINNTLGGVKKTAGGTTWNAEAVASGIDPNSQTVPPATVPLAIQQTGYIGFKANINSVLAVGLTASNDNVSQNDLEFMIQLTATETASVWEGNGTAAPTSKVSLGSYDANTHFAIRRTGGQIEYLKNGVVLYTSTTTVPVGTTLYIDSSYSAQNSEVISAYTYNGDIDWDGMADSWEIAQYQRQHGVVPSYTQLESFGPDDHEDDDGASNKREYLQGTDPFQTLSVAKPITWTSLSGTQVWGAEGGIKKTLTNSGFNADATSSVAMSGNGSFSFSTPAGVVALGLTYSDDGATDADLEYAFVLAAPVSGVSAVSVQRPESPTDLGVGTCTNNTVFTIRRTGAVVEFLKDGVVVCVSTTPSYGPLYADISISDYNHLITNAYMDDGDADGDGLPDWWEILALTHGQTPPPDVTLQAIQNFTPEDLGTDDDVSNADEWLHGTSPTSSDTDGDGMPDRWEIDHGLAATDPSNGAADLDSDGLTNRQEYNPPYSTNPANPDTDGDGMGDKYEKDYGLVGTDSWDALHDKDGDQIPNYWEFCRGTNPASASSKPAVDIIIDVRQSQALTTVQTTNEHGAPHTVYTFREMGLAFGLLPSLQEGAPDYCFVIQVKRGVHAGSGANVAYRKVALIGERGVTHMTPWEGSLLQGQGLELRNDFYVDSLIFEAKPTSDHTNDPVAVKVGSGSGVAFKPAEPNIPGQVAIPAVPHPRGMVSNCVMRDMHAKTTWYAGDLPTIGGALNNEQGYVSLLHCSLMNCTGYYDFSIPNDLQTPENEQLTGSAPSTSVFTTEGGFTLLGNCLIWEDFNIWKWTETHAPNPNENYTGWRPGYPLFAYLGPTGFIGLSVTHPMFIGAALHNPSPNPGGYITQNANWMSGTSLGHLTVTQDIKGQTRSISSPTAGAVEWINGDGDSMPDWWERWWFVNTSKGNNFIPHEFVFDADSIDYRAKTALQHYLAFSEPTSSQDGDSLPDDWERFWFNGSLTQVDGSNPDEDGRTNLEEFLAGTNPNAVDSDDDSDGDQLPDEWERTYFTEFPKNPLRYDRSCDPDDDKWNNSEEFARGTNPNNPLSLPAAFDSEPDGLPDEWETRVFGNIFDENGGTDFDKDGINNVTEYLAGTDPTRKPYNWDADSNRLWDWWEANWLTGLPPGMATASADADGDGRSNEQEMIEGTNPRSATGNVAYQNVHDFSMEVGYTNQEYTQDVFFDQYIIPSITRRISYQGLEQPETWVQAVPTSPYRRVLPAESIAETIYDGPLYNNSGEFEFFANGTAYGVETTTHTLSNARMCLPNFVSSNGGADHLIIRAFRRRLQGTAEIFYIRPGRTHAEGLSCILPAPTRYMKPGNPPWTKLAVARERLDPINLPVQRYLPPSDMAGPRYRKVGLNGVPMPDSVPGEQNDESALPEETYVDAYNRQLRHSTSDIWARSPSTDLPVQVRRDLAPECWSWQSGLRPDERPDRPFGPCWTSNLTPHIKLEVQRNVSDRWNNWYYNTKGNAPNYSPNTDPEYVPTNANERYLEKLKSPPRITLSDERGASYSFTDLGGAPLTTGIGFEAKWVGSPDERYDAKTAFDTLTQLPAGLAENAQTFTLTKRNGTVCHYVRCTLTQSYPASRRYPDASRVENYYFRLVSVETAQANRLEYIYPPDTTNAARSSTLIPSEIRDPHRSDCKVVITQAKGRITSVRGPSEEVVHYHYSEEPEEIVLSDLQRKRENIGVTTQNMYPVLTSVSRNSETEVLQEVKYEYSYDYEVDPTPDLTIRGLPTFGHLELSKITSRISDNLESSHTFDYVVNHAVNSQHPNSEATQYKTWNGIETNTRKQAAIPRLLTKITRPDHTTGTPSEVIFTGQRNVLMELNGAVTGQIQTTVAANNTSYTYTFHAPHVAKPIELIRTSDFFQGDLPEGDINEGVVYLSFTKMDIQSAAGTEKYEFSPAAGMALTSVTDLSNNKTEFIYNDPVKVGVFNMLQTQYYDDPKIEISAVDGTPRDPGNVVPGYGEPGAANHVSRKTYEYHPTFRTRISMTDELGVMTRNILDPNTGLCLQEEVWDTKGTPLTTGDDVILRRSTFSYAHPTQPVPAEFSAFKAFLYRKTVKTDGFTVPAGYSLLNGESPSLEMVTDYLPDPDPDGAGARTSNGRVWKEIRYAGPNRTVPLTTTTTYTPGGQKRTVTDPLEHVTTFEYYPQTLRLKSTLFADNTSKQLFYDKHGNITREELLVGTDTVRERTLHAYDICNRRVTTTIDLDLDGFADASYNPATVTLPATNVADMPTYGGDMVTSTTYNGFNLPVTVTDPRGVVTQNVYDAIGRLIQTTVNATGGEQQITTYIDDQPGTIDFVGGSVFDTKGFKPIHVIDPRGFMTTFQYDAAYRVLSTTLEDTGSAHSPAMTVTTHTRYDDAGNALYQVDALGRITQTVYDKLSRPIQVIHPQDVNTPASSTKVFYTPADLVWRTLDEAGAEILTYYDHAGRNTRMVAPAVLDHATQQMMRPTSITVYDAAGNPVQVTDPLGRVTDTLYDSRNRPVLVKTPAVLNVTMPLGTPSMVRPEVATAYDYAGRPTHVTDPMGAVTETKYDQAGRAWRVIAPVTGVAPNQQHHVTTNRLDQGGNILQFIDAKGQIVTNVYDAFNRLIETEDPKGIVNTFAYDKAGNRTSVLDGLDQETLFYYDAQNRLVKQVFAGGDSVVFHHNAIQKTSQVATPQPTVSETTIFGYDARDRLLTVVSPDLSRVNSYDAVGRLLSVTESTNAQAAVTITYNAAGWVMSETSCGVTHAYGYDITGSRVHAAYGTGSTVITAYDALNRPLTITDNAGTPSSSSDDRITSYGYDLAGRAVRLLQPNGNLAWNAYDVLARLTDRTLFAYNPEAEDEEDKLTELTELKWFYDPLGNVVSHDENWPGSSLRSPGWRKTTMAYDGANRLEQEVVSHSAVEITRTTYTYDDANNRETKTVEGDGETGVWTYGYNEANQLLQWEKSAVPMSAVLKYASFTYDRKGNRLTQRFREGSDPFLDTSYSWDAQNRLTDVAMPDTTVYEYAYDYRIRRIRTERSGGSAATQATTIAFSGGLSIAEWEAENAEPSTSNSPTVEYNRGPDMGGGVGGLLYTLRGSTPKYNLSNGRGDIIAQADGNGALTWTASYEAYGKRTKETGTNVDKQRANSKDEDPTGLLNEGFRYRDIETGVWLSRDPAGFVDGPNLYAYVMQNPWTMWDPHGLEKTGKQARESASKNLSVRVPDKDGTFHDHTKESLDSFYDGLPKDVQAGFDEARWGGADGNFADAGYYGQLAQLATTGEASLPPTESQRKTAESAHAEAEKSTFKFSRLMGGAAGNTGGFPDILAALEPEESLDTKIGAVLGLGLLAFESPTSEPKLASYGRSYSVAFEMKLNKIVFGRSRSVHFNRANEALDNALQADVDFAAQMETLIPGVQSSVSKTGGRKTPTDWIWHHDRAPGVMQLVPGSQHTPGSIFWKTFHPGGRGGYSLWAIPNGAPRN